MFSPRLSYYQILYTHEIILIPLCPHRERLCSVKDHRGNCLCLIPSGNGYEKGNSSVLQIHLPHLSVLGQTFLLSRLLQPCSSVRIANEKNGIFASEDKAGHIIGFVYTVIGRNRKGCICFLEVLCFRPIR